MNEEKPLTRAELAELHRLRIGKPASRALPADAYRSQAEVIKYERERAEAKRRQEEKRMRAGMKKRAQL